jgi:hypothetical protein
MEHEQLGQFLVFLLCAVFIGSVAFAAMGIKLVHDWVS